ncbi:TetR family transcriptional regulator [Mycobacterium adipatum]|uniref:TetR family transcriptional regulator n=1 Tax=Mycobacterium adipatum TaxID=1682113 RepID=A0A172UQL8_9MYCO|nr:TetR/AcrR family transcriptional regulator [Mycobacterium adipatum]ANE81457.1 TetR family transcriptional regulator [Mycobacterium adipatum]MBI5734984.1 TetR/AcrR family transcriptional regulator [Mycolicibacterium neoaurum]
MPRPAAKRQRRERGSISVEEILTGAFEVAAEVSIDNLSMPQLAKHLDVGVTSIYWYFRRKDDLLDAMTNRALDDYDFTAPSIDAGNWRESLRHHARMMRKTFRANPILCDLILIRGSYGRAAVQGAIQKLEPPVAALVRAGLSSEDAFDTYSAIATHVRGTVIMEHLQDKMPGIAPRQDGERNLIDAAATPHIAEATGRGHRMGVADDINFEYVLECILAHAESLAHRDI